MSTTLTIPAGLVPDVREGLFSLVGDAAGGLMYAVEQPENERHPEWFKAPLERLDRACALLNLLGSDAGCPSIDTDVELDEYGQTLDEAIAGYLPVREEQAMEADLTDNWLAQHGRPPKKPQVLRRLAALRDFATLLERRLAEIREQQSPSSGLSPTL
jgi:hypothetical protein